LAIDKASFRTSPQAAWRNGIRRFLYCRPIMAALGLKSKENLRKLYIALAMKKGMIVMGMSDKKISRNQTYIKQKG